MDSVNGELEEDETMKWRSLNILETTRYATLVWVFLLLLSCHKNGGTDVPSGAGKPVEQVTRPQSQAPKPKPIRLADSPAIDLIDNRFQWHLYSSGLIIPVATEGFRKYTQEYRSPWSRRAIDVGGKRGRPLLGRVAVLRFPWQESQATSLRLRLHGVADKQAVTAAINNRRLPVTRVAANWSTVDIPLAGTPLRSGENELRLSFKQRGKAGGVRAYALIHSIALTSKAVDANDQKDWPALSPAREVTIENTKISSLAGFETLALHVEIPRTAWLTLATGLAAESASFRIHATSTDGKKHVLLNHTQTELGWQSHRIPLKAVGEKLVRLEFAMQGPRQHVAWGHPRIRLEHAEVRPRPAPIRNLILFVVDALRSDRLAIYGETRVRTPRITAEAKRHGVAFLYNQAASPSSPPSHGSIQTGMIPRVHGVAGDKSELIQNTPMISTVLRANGIATGYFGNNTFGMARLEKPGNWTAFHQPSREGFGFDCKPLIEQILGFAKQHGTGDGRFFVSSLPYEPHTPYRYHEGITNRFYAGPYDPPLGKSISGDMLGAITGGSLSMNKQRWAQLKALYDGEVEYMDGCFSQLLDGLKTLGIDSQTAIVLTSDHGEGMYEHGRMGHAFGHYAELADVPLVLLAPGLVETGTRLPVVSNHIDIAPTIMDLMGVKPHPRIQGMSLVPIALRAGPWTPRVVSLEYGRSYALRAKGWKYIVDYSGNESLFDLEADPTEQSNLIGKQPIAQRYLRDLAGFFLAHRKQWRSQTWGPLNNHKKGFLRHVEVKGVSNE